jgi:hypothetical protein
MEHDFKLTKARQEHICSKCGLVIEPGDKYYKEEKFLAGLHRPLLKYCIKCYELNHNSI